MGKVIRLYGANRQTTDWFTKYMQVLELCIMNVEKSQCLAHLHNVLICSSWLLFSSSTCPVCQQPISACTNCHSSLTMFGELCFRPRHLSSYSLGMSLYRCRGLIWITAYYTSWMSPNCFQYHVANIWAYPKPGTILIQHQTRVQNWRFFLIVPSLRTPSAVFFSKSKCGHSHWPAGCHCAYRAEGVKTAVKIAVMVTTLALQPCSYSKQFKAFRNSEFN